ncbi:phage tail tape measure protein [Vibrio mediterranei]|uniref:phage tail length tape measure family protein n=1 Tax=Vibrio mediterranei TaxID=689 RepID=UPI000D184316|nr:phage tail length tape measure family protein [Vibrio mediterranei]PTC01986.1 phage tail tape measure protein [Vibrio mediterranei]
MAQRFIDLIATLDADTAQLDRKVNRSGKAVKDYGSKAKGAERSNKKLSSSFSKAANSAASLPGPLGNAVGQVDTLVGSVSQLGVVYGAVGLAATAFIGSIAAGLPVLAESERRMLQQEQLLRATGNASGYTVEQLDMLARKVAEATLTNTEQASKAIGVMLTFRSVMNDQNKTFERSIYLAQSMASVLNTDIVSASKQLGKALEMPSEGMTALRRAGLSFTLAQKDMVKSMEDAGDVASAQQFILAELENQLGKGAGAGGAESQGLIGAMDLFSQYVDEVFEAFTKWSGIKPVVQDVVDELNEGLLVVRDFFAPTTTDEALDLMSERAKVLSEMNAEVAKAGGKDKLSSLFGYTKSDWFNDQRRLTEISTRLDELKAKRDKRLKEEQAAQGAMQKSAAEREKEREREKRATEEKAAEEKAARVAARAKAQEERDKATAQRERSRNQQTTEDWLQDLSRRTMAESELLNAKYMDEAMRLAKVKRDGLVSEENYQTALKDIQQHYGNERLELAKRQQQALEEENQHFWDRYATSMQESAYNTDELWSKTFDNFTTNFGSAFASAVMQSESVGDAFASMARGMAQSMIAAIGKIIAQRMVLWAIEKAMFTKGVSNQVVKVAAEAQSASKVAAINAYKSTAAIPYSGPAMAPAAASAAMAFTEPLAAAATAAAASGLAGMAHEGISAVPKEGTWLLEKGERVYTNQAADKLDKMYDILQSVRPGASSVRDINLNVTMSPEQNLDTESIHHLASQFRTVVKEELVDNLRPGGLLNASI